MGDTEIKGLKLDTFGHVGLIVKDVDATIKSWSAQLGSDSWEVKEAGPLKLAFGKIGSVKFELIEPLEKGNLWSEFLEKNDEGLHHISTSVDDVDDAVDKIVSSGGKALAHIPGQFAYVKMGGPGGIIVELSGKPNK